MKKQIMLFLAFLMINLTVITGQFSVGVHTSVGFNDMKVSGVGSTIGGLPSTLVSANYGISTAYRISNNFELQSEINHTTRGFAIEESMDVNVLGIDIPIGLRVETQLKSIEMPILAKYYLPMNKFNVYAEAGPSISYITSGSITSQAKTFLDINLPNIDINLDDPEYNRFDLGLNLGLGAEYILDNGFKIKSNIRFTHGVNNAIADQIIDLKLKHQAVNIGVGLVKTF